MEKKKKKRIKGGNLLCFSSANSTNYANFLGKNIICHKIEIKKTLYNPTKRKKGEKEGKRRNFFIILSNANSTNYFANVMGENKTHQIFHVTKLKKQKKMKKNACSWFSIRNNGPWAMWGCFWFFFFSSWGCLGGGGGGVVFFAETGQKKTPKVKHNVKKWGNKMRYESPITKLSSLLSPTHALREKERKGRERDTEQVRVCVVRSQMCVL